MPITLSGTTVSVTGSFSSGTATSGASTSLTDTAKAWSTNQLQWRIVYLTSGTGAGQSRMIVSNTNNSFTVDHAWTTTPNSTTQYTVCFDASDFVSALPSNFAWNTNSTDRDIRVLTTVQSINYSGGYIGLTKDSWNFLYQTCWFTSTTIEGSFIQFGALSSDGTSHSGSTQVVRISVASPNPNYLDLRIAGIKRAYGSNFTVQRNPIDGEKFFRLNAVNIQGGDFGPADIRDNTFRHNFIFNVGANLNDIALRNQYIQSYMSFEGSMSQISDNTDYCSYYGITGNGHKGQNITNIKVLGDLREPYWYAARPAFVNSDAFKTAGAKQYWIDPQFRSPFVFANAIGWYRHPNTPLTSDQRIFLARNITIKTINSSLQDLGSVKVGLWDANNSPAWTTSKDPTSYVPVKTGVITTNGTGDQSSLVVVQDQYVAFSGASNTGNVATVDPYRVTSTYRPFTLTARKYGFIERSRESRDWGISGTDQIKLDTNSFVSASEATAATFASKIGITVTSGVATYSITDASSTQQIYDFSQWWAAQSANMINDIPITSTGLQFTFTAGTKITLSAIISGAKIVNGDFSLASGWGITCPIENSTLTFPQAGTYDFRSVAISGTVTLVNTSGGGVTVRLQPDVLFVNSGPNITVDSSVSAVLTVNNLAIGSQLLLRRTDNQVVLANASIITSTFTYTYSHTANIPVEIIVRKATSAPFYREWRVVTTLTSVNSTQTANQESDE